MNPDTIVQSLLSDQFGPCALLPADAAGLNPRAGVIFVGDIYVATTRPGLLEHYADLELHAQRVEHDCYVLYAGDPDNPGCPVMAIIRAADLQAAA